MFPGHPCMGPNFGRHAKDSVFGLPILLPAFLPFSAYVGPQSWVSDCLAVKLPGWINVSLGMVRKIPVTRGRKSNSHLARQCAPTSLRVNPYHRSSLLCTG